MWRVWENHKFSHKNENARQGHTDKCTHRDMATHVHITRTHTLTISLRGIFRYAWIVLFFFFFVIEEVANSNMYMRKILRKSEILHLPVYCYVKWLLLLYEDCCVPCACLEF